MNQTALLSKLYHQPETPAQAKPPKQIVRDISTCPDKSRRSQISKLLRMLSRKLERKWASNSDERYEDWDYRNAADHFCEVTGYKYEAARKYFRKIEDAAEWRDILGGEPTIKDRIYCIGYSRSQLP